MVRIVLKYKYLDIEITNLISWIISGEGDVTLEISESSLARNVLSKMSALSCLYTVQITPRTDVDSVEVVFFDHLEKDSGLFGFFRSRLN